MNDHIAIRATHRHPRLQYIARVLSQWWPVKVILQTKGTSYGPCIEYGTGGSGVYISPHDFLAGRGPLEMTALFPDTPFDQFDPLSGIFWHLSRFEEYQPFDADRHGRFPATASLSYKMGLINQPIAVIWADRLYDSIRKQYPRLPEMSRPFELRPTYDVDMVWAFHGRKWRGLARAGLDMIQGQIKMTRTRLASWRNRENDPFYTFSLLTKWHQELNLEPHYFFLLSDFRSRFDPNVSPNNPKLQALIRELAAQPNHSIGIHPSYHSLERPELVSSETKTLSHILGRTPTGSRQHFLRLRFPDTYRALIKAGLRADYSMGYADAPGWRAGTHLPYPWYDLEREEATRFQIHPFAFMDVTLKNYQKLSPQDASKVMHFYRDQIQALGGPLYSLWHNSSFSEAHGWQGYGEVYEDYLRRPLGLRK
ncbi:MAG: polysaccharide deacetylase family protein [Bacteroidota bacterium]